MNKRVSRLLSMALALVLCFAMATPVKAAKTAANKSGKVQFDKILYVDQYAVLPASGLDFTFTLAAGTAPTGITGFEGYAGNLNGVSAAANTEVGTVADDVTWASPTVTVKYKTGDKTSTDAAVQITKSFNLDFNGVLYNADTNANGINKPGVYRYTLTEDTTTSPIAGVTYNNNGTSPTTGSYYIDVYVQYDDSEPEKLEIANIIVSTSTSYGAGSDEDDNYEGKVNATPGTTTGGTSGAQFCNKLNTYDLEVKKTVTGNQGDRTKDFKFSVTISGLVDGQNYTYQTVKDTTATTTATAENGTITLTDLTLKDAQGIKFLDLPYGATYTVTEDPTSAAGYKTTATVTGDDTTITSNTTSSGSSSVAGGAVTDDKTGNTNGGGLTGDATVTYENNKEGTIPTGILMTIAPFVALMLIGLVGAIVILMKKRTTDK